MAQRKADWRVGVYVRVHGHLRSFEKQEKHGSLQLESNP